MTLRDHDFRRVARHHRGDSCRADQCPGTDCDHCREVRAVVHAPLPEPGTPERDAIDADVMALIATPRDKYDDGGVR